MRNIIEFAVKNRVTILMLVFGILLLGKISYDELGTDLLPNLNNPRLYIEITAGERPPEEIEKAFIKNMEALVIRQSDVTGVSSIIKAGSAQITVDYTWKKDMNEAFLDLQKALNSYSQNRNIDEIKITQNDPNSEPVMLIGMSNDNINDMSLLRKVADGYIRNELVRIEGVADVALTGDEVKSLVIDTEPYKLSAFGLSIETIISKITENNQSISGGRITDLGRQYIVKGVSNLASEDDFKRLIVGYKNVSSQTTGANSSSATAGSQAPIYLGDVANVSFENEDPENIVRINGKRSIGLSIYKEVRFNTVKVVDNITEEIKKIEKALPGYEFKVISNQGTFIKQAVGEVKSTAILGIILAVFILFVFLRRIGTTLIVSIAIPISIVATFNLMYFGGLTLNIMTLGGLALGAGMLVDNAIVVIESIFRNQEKGLTPEKAAVNGTSDVAMAVTASTLTTIVVFLPIVYLHGASGELFKDQAWTVTFSLVSSLFVAILVIPMLYVQFAGKKKEAVSIESKSLKFEKYGVFLRNLLKRRKLVLCVAALVLIITGLLTPLLKSEFMPKPEGNSFEVNVKIAEGSSMETTSNFINGLENVIRNFTGDSLCVIYAHIGSNAGYSNTVFEGDNSAKIRVNLLEGAPNINKVIAHITDYTKDIDDVELSFTQSNNSLSSLIGTENSPLVVEIKGEELDKIATITNDVKQRMLGIEGITNVVSSIEDGAPEVNIILDRTFCGINNITISSVINQITQQLDGSQGGQIEYEGELRNIVIKLPKVELAQLGQIIITSGEKTYNLNDIATFQTGNAPKEIIRNNQVREGKITADFTKGFSLDEEAKAIKEAVKDIELPHNYSISVTGEEEKRAESMDSLMFALLLSVILVYMVLASQFESLLHPFTILFTIPLAVVGAILLFLITNTTLNIMGVIGMVMLVGIAVNNSIILIDRINQLKISAPTLEDAIVEAGKQRIRPILMTTLTTILALLPLCITFGEGSSLRAPMAIAVIGGLITSTAMSLMVIPCLYLVFERIAKRK